MAGLHRAFHQGCLKTFSYYLDNPNQPPSAESARTRTRKQTEPEGGKRQVKFKLPEVATPKTRTIPKAPQTTASADAVDSLGLSPLMKCVLYDDVRDVLPFVRTLLRHRADLNKVEPFTRLNVFQLALLLRRCDLAQLILEADHLDLDLLAQDAHGNTAFHHLCFLLHAHDNDEALWRTALHLLKRVEKWKVNIDVENERAMTPLHLAAAYGNVRLARCFVAIGSSPNRFDTRKRLNAFGWLQQALHTAVDFSVFKDAEKALKDSEILVRPETSPEPELKAAVPVIDMAKLAAECRYYCENATECVPRRYRLSPNAVVALLSQLIDAASVLPTPEAAVDLPKTQECANMAEVQRTFVMYEVICAASFRKPAVSPKPEEENTGEEAPSEEIAQERSSTSVSLSSSQRLLANPMRKVSHAIIAARPMRRSTVITPSLLQN